MFKFNPTIEEKNNDAKEGYQVFPEGEYDFVVKRATKKMSKSGNEMLEVILTCSNEENKTDVFDWLLEAMKHKLKHFCETTGFIKEYENGEIDEDFIVGAKGKVNLIVEDSEAYGTRNKVKDYVVNGTKIEIVSGSSDDFISDDIPF